MSSLFGIMSVALGALRASQGALEATSNNVANANTPGFSRQRAVLVPGDPVTEGSLTFGTGVMLQRLESVRDPLLELRLDQESQHNSQLDSLVSSLQPIEVMFSDSNSGLGDGITKFFNSLNQLSTDPASLTLRQGVLAAASNLANVFHSTASNMQLQRSNLDLNVGQAVVQVNQLTIQIAQLNHQIGTLEHVGQDGGALVDKRTQAIRQLAQLIDVSTIQTGNGIALTTSNGTALVAGDQSLALTAQLQPDGMLHVFSQAQDLTAQLTGGKLAGLLQVRDQSIPSLLGNLDTLAAGLANGLNSANRGGFDLSGAVGGDLLVPPPASGRGAAASFALAINDASLLAASSDGSPGSGGNLAVLSALHDQATIQGRTPTEFYADLVASVGSEVSSGTAQLDASQLILRQLQDQRGAISGVSLDEEAANLLQYQRAYQAAARVITAVNDILDSAIHLGKD